VALGVELTKTYAIAELITLVPASNKRRSAQIENLRPMDSCCVQKPQPLSAWIGPVCRMGGAGRNHSLSPIPILNKLIDKRVLYT
jgi:hypothetical protein